VSASAAPAQRREGDYARTHTDAARMTRPPLVVTEPLTDFLDAHGLGSGQLECHTIAGGNSNFVCELRRDGLHAVLRRPPRPPLPPRAHDMLREAKVLEGLAGRVRAPRVLAVCADPAVIGAPFYVMEHLDGHVLSDGVPAALDDAASCHAAGLELVDALAEIHAVDPAAAGLEGLARPGRYLERQLRLFTTLWTHNRTRPLPAVERIARRLACKLPRDEQRTVVHGDFRLGNAMFAPDPPARAIAVFDWEMATLGDPLADLGYLTATWIEPDDPELAIFGRTSVMRDPRFARRAELVERYSEATGRAAGETIDWYRALALWKTVVFMEGNYRRARAGRTDDPFLLTLDKAVPQLADYIEEVVLP
jgi:aminoglycoside phosphotransferase (APT) family kinase protein